MSNYKFHGASANGERTDGREIICRNDVEALSLADDMLRGYVTIEVWLDDTLIGTSPKAPIFPSELSVLRGNEGLPLLP